MKSVMYLIEVTSYAYVAWYLHAKHTITYNLKSLWQMTCELCMPLHYSWSMVYQPKSTAIYIIKCVLTYGGHISIQHKWSNYRRRFSNWIECSKIIEFIIVCILLVLSIYLSDLIRILLCCVSPCMLMIFGCCSFSVFFSFHLFKKTLVALQKSFW